MTEPVDTRATECPSCGLKEEDDTRAGYWRWWIGEAADFGACKRCGWNGVRHERAVGTRALPWIAHVVYLHDDVLGGVAQGRSGLSAGPVAAFCNSMKAEEFLTEYEAVTRAKLSVVQLTFQIVEKDDYIARISEAHRR